MHNDDQTDGRFWIIDVSSLLVKKSYLVKLVKLITGNLQLTGEIDLAQNR
jgi:hypothetical protein